MIAISDSVVRADGIGIEIADRRLAGAQCGGAAVERDVGLRDGDVEFLRQFVLEPAHRERAPPDRARYWRCRSGGYWRNQVMRRPSRVSSAMVRSITVTISPSCARFDDGGAAVIVDEQIVVVAGENEVGGAALEQRHVLIARRMHHRHDEVGAFGCATSCIAPASRRPAARISRRRNWQSCGVSVERGAGQSDLDAADVENASGP